MKKVFFTGHRDSRVYTKDMHKAINLLHILVIEGARDFYAGGARGWDLRFEEFVVDLREDHFPMIKLHLVLPCPPEEQTSGWSEYDKQLYEKMLKAADSVEIVSPHYDKGCMKKRNERLVELGDICVCYYNENHKHSGTGQTVRMAKKQGKEIINLYVDRSED